MNKKITCKTIITYTIIITITILAVVYNIGYSQCLVQH